MTISGERTKQLNIFCRVTGFTSDFLSFIYVELIRFFHGAVQFKTRIQKHHLEGSAIPAGYSHTNAHYAGGVNNYLNSNHADFSLPSSQLRPDVRDRQMSDVHHRLMPYGGGGIIIVNE